MDIRELRHLVALAQAGSFSKAETTLYVSRQAIAKTLRHIEAQAGTKLFTRRKNQLVPTAKGAQVIEEGTRLLAEWEDFKQRNFPFAVGTPGTSGTPIERVDVRLALVTGGSVGLPVGFFESFGSIHPEVNLYVEEMSSDALCVEVAHGESDLGIVGSHPSLLAEFDRIAMLASGLWVIVPEGHPLSHKATLTLADLNHMPFVTAGPRNHLHRYIEARCALEGVHFDVVAQASSGAMILQLAREREALCFGFKESATRHEGVTVKPLVFEGAESFGTYVIRRKGHDLAPGATTLWEYIQAGC